MRGVNYIPSYAASSVEMWNDYQPARIDDELAYLAGMGVNTVRIFMNVWGWVADPAQYEAAFDHFLATAYSHGIHVMPVIFDSFGTEPSDTPWEELSPPYWVKAPGTDWLERPTFHTFGDDYLGGLTTVAAEAAANEYDSLLMWDVMNEPDGEGVDGFVTRYAVLLRQLDPSKPITIGAAHPSFFNSNHTDEVDVISYHPYGIFAENVAHYTAIAREIAQGKPLVASEIGYPGAAQPYDEALDHITDENVGFCLFQGVIGDNVNHPFRSETGFFYVDGEIRDQESYDAFIEVTQDQGGTFGGTPAVKDSGRLWLPQEHVVLGFGEPEVAALLSDFDGVYGTGPYPLLDNTSHMLYRTALVWSFISFNWVEQATGQEILQAFDLGDLYDERVAAEDYVGAELILRDWVDLGKVIFERMRPPAAVPIFGTWGLTGMATLLLGLGAIFLHTRRRTV
jgi:hypothetical protein